MSVTGHSVPSGFNKISLQWRNYSGELDVFEATQYFSGSNETPGYTSPNLGQSPVKNVRRMSLDLPKSNIISPQINQIPEKQILKENKKYKQPSSPGARIASFLNSLFNQKSVKKKKKLKSGGTTNDPGVENPGHEQRRRRSGISNFPVTNSAVAHSKSIYSTSSSGFTTPHVYSNTPTKSHKEFRSFSDPLQHAFSVPKSSENFKPGGSLKNEECDVKRSTDYAWSDEKLSFRNGSSAKVVRNGSSAFADHKKCSTNYWFENYSSEVQEFRKFNHGGDSDSSSDLFDLPNYELDFCSSTGLPVYETTQMDSIKKSVLIPSTATV